MKVSPEEFFEHVEKTRAHEVALKIKGDYLGYRLSCSFENKSATIYFQSTNAFNSDKRVKNIGTLVYNEQKDIVTYCKYGFVEETHKYNKTESIGLCWDILQHLSASGDCILITEKGKSGKIKKYSISAFKALRFSTPENFKHFRQQGYEKQVLIPKSEFKVIEG